MNSLVCMCRGSRVYALSCCPLMSAETLVFNQLKLFTSLFAREVSRRRRRRRAIQRQENCWLLAVFCFVVTYFWRPPVLGRWRQRGVGCRRTPRLHFSCKKRYVGSKGGSWYMIRFSGQVSFVMLFIWMGFWSGKTVGRCYVGWLGFKKITDIATIWLVI